MFKNTRFVKVQTFTWSKDSHGLFDYESSNLTTGKFTLSNGGKFFRNLNEIQLVETSPMAEETVGDGLIYLFDIEQNPMNPGINYSIFVISYR